MEMVRRIAWGQDGVVTRAQAVTAGLARYDVDSLCRAGHWRRLSRNAYLVQADPLQAVPRRARIRAAVLSLGPGAVAVLGTAAELHGIAGLRRTEDIHVSVPGPAAKVPGVRDPAVIVHQLRLDATDRVAVAGIAVTSPIRTVSDVILRVDRFAAVSVLDSAVCRGLVPADPGPVLVRIRGRRGALAARDFLTEVDGRAQSPLETRVRLRCVDGRVPPDELQHPIRDADGHLLGVADLAWRRARIIAEADGAAPHDEPQALYQDRRRQNRIANAGWTILRFTWPDTLRPDYIPHVVTEAHRRSWAPQQEEQE